MFAPIPGASEPIATAVNTAACLPQHPHCIPHILTQISHITIRRHFSHACL
jgi:hypothetical protein